MVQNRITNFAYSLILMLCSLLSLASGLAAAETETGKSALIAAETRLADAVKQNGAKSAFLAVLHDSSIVYQPIPINGKVWASQLPDTERLLQWEPALVELSSTPDFGYTIGQWWKSLTDSTPPTASGAYLSIWKQTDSGKWRIVLYARMPHAFADTNVDYLPERRSDRIAKSKLPKRSVDEAIRSMCIADNVYSTLANKKDLFDAFRNSAATDIRLLRPDHLPVTGANAALAWLSVHPTKENWTIAGADMASTGDIGYTCGLIIPPDGNKNGNNTGCYVRIWRLDNEEVWRLAVDYAYFPVK